MENQNLRNEIIKKVPHLETKFWSYYSSAIEHMRSVVWTKIRPNIRSADPMAFVTRSRQTTGVFEVYVNATIPYECREPLELHEFGHVIFTHMSLLKSQREIIINKIMSSWNVFKRYVEEYVTDTPEKLKATATVICNAILNIAMDYEVNSKLFTESEWETFKEYASWAYIQASASAPKTSKEELEKILEWVNDTNPDKKSMFEPCWPGDRNYPLKLDYRQYVDLMIMNPDETMESIMDAIKNAKNGNGSGSNGDESDGEGSGELQGNGNGKLTKEEVDKLREQYSDANEEVSNDALDTAEKEEAEEKGYAGKRGEYNTHNWSPERRKRSSNEEVLSITQNKELERRLLREVFNKHILDAKSDCMYYYNRQKYNSNVLLTKMKPEELYKPGNIYLLVDCSGSVGSTTLSALVGVAKNISKKCGPFSRIVWWDTDLCGDYPIRNFKNPQNGSGCTDITSGIAYMKKKWIKNKNDKLIIISDYIDSLSHWYDELKNIKCDCIGICWSFDTVSDIISSLKELNVVESNNSEMANLLKILPTVFVHVPGAIN